MLEFAIALPDIGMLLLLLLVHGADTWSWLCNFCIGIATIVIVDE